MNTEKNILLKVMDWIVQTLARTLVIIFDGIHTAVNHATPSLFALVATLLPFLLPLPVAFMTAHSAQHFFNWEAWTSNILGFGLEGLGLLVWVKLVDGIIANVNTKNEKVNDFVNFLWLVAAAYEALLILINVVLAWKDGADLIYATTLFFICLLPALSAAMYGLHKREVIAQLASEATEQKNEAERLRQERRADRKEAAAFKIQYAKDSEVAELEDKTFRLQKRK
jgi:hypothetical protein